MKTRVAGLATALMVMAVVTSCGKKEHAPSGAGSPQGQPQTPVTHEDELQSTPWLLRYVANCGDEKDRSDCAGAYGFEISSDGTYRIGPGPDGQEIRGFLEDEDLGGIRGKLGELRSAFTERSECGHADKRESLGLVELRMKGDRSDSCDPRISKDLSELLQRYAPKKFPNPCADADADLRKAFDSAMSCESDADCAFLSGDFLPLDANRKSEHDVVVDDCSYASILPVANAFRAVEFQSELILKREIVKGVCGSIRKPLCRHSHSFDPWKSTIACVEGRCRLGSTRYKPQ